MSFQIIGVPAASFTALYGLSDSELAGRNAKRYVVDAQPGFPDRIELRDADIGETVILVHYEHQPAATPYRASHAIFVREGAVKTRVMVDDIPQVLRSRPISVRAFDAAHWMVEADLAAGTDLEDVIENMLTNARVDYLQLHFAKPGCYAARVERLTPLMTK